MQRSAMRELAFKLIYGIEVQKELDEDYLELFFESNDVVKEDVKKYLTEIKEGIKKYNVEIEELINHKVAINEVVELAKQYSDEQAPIFINGILASIVKEKGLEEEKKSEN